MAVGGTEFYFITNGLIVCMIGIAVADSIHIFPEYYVAQTADPALFKANAIALAMARMWRPVTLTSLTTAAGFLTLFVTPSLLFFFARGPAFFRRQSSFPPTRRLAKVLGALPLNHPRKVLLSGALIAGLALVGASNVLINKERIENFLVDYIKQMNKAFNEDVPAFYALPDDKNLIACLFLLYTASGDPTDFEERVDSQQKRRWSGQI